MKILIKSVEEIGKTLDVHEEKDGILYDMWGMGGYSGKVLDTQGEKSSHGYHRASDWTWHNDWIHVLSEKYDYEKFESLEDAVLWIANKGGILSKGGTIIHNDWSTSYLAENWKYWHKAIPVKPKTLQVVRYVNVYVNGEIRLYENKKEADKYAASHCIDCKRIELNYELKDGKWVEA